jgi:hypothetical protein
MPPISILTGLASVPQEASEEATSTIFQEVKVEYIPGATPPSITEDVQDQQIFVSQTASFSVLASGTLPLFYQWYYNTNSLLTNATSSSISITNAQLTDAGGYSVVVSNVYGVVTSSVAQLSVSTPDMPSIITPAAGHDRFARRHRDLYRGSWRLRASELSVVLQHEHAGGRRHRQHVDADQRSTEPGRRVLRGRQQPRGQYYELQRDAQRQYKPCGADVYPEPASQVVLGG